MSKSDFPIFDTHPELVYLDTAASAQKPRAVIEAVSHFYQTSYANIHRGLYDLSIQSTEQYEAVREKVANFIGAPSAQEIVFTKNATEGLNLLASSLTVSFQPGEEIILSELEHHANLVPWQQAAEKHGLVLKFTKLTENGELDLDHFRSLVTPNTRVVSVSHCSNVLGTITPIPLLKKILHEQGSDALLIIDAGQSVPHFPVSVTELGADFLVFSGHKVYAPSGTGVLWGRAALLEQLPPYQTGGDMVQTVSLEAATWQDVPGKFEAGTPNIEGVIGLGAAIDYLQTIGMENVSRMTEELMKMALEQFSTFPEVTLLSVPRLESGIIAFTVAEIHPHDLAEMLANQQVCIRAGHHCAAPLHSQLGVAASNRLSMGVYTTREDLEKFFEALRKSINFFQTGHV